MLRFRARGLWFADSFSDDPAELDDTARARARPRVVRRISSFTLSLARACRAAAPGRRGRGRTSAVVRGDPRRPRRRGAARAATLRFVEVSPRGALEDAVNPRQAHQPPPRDGAAATLLRRRGGALTDADGPRVIVWVSLDAAESANAPAQRPWATRLLLPRVLRYARDTAEADVLIVRAVPHCVAAARRRRRARAAAGESADDATVPRAFGLRI